MVRYFISLISDYYACTERECTIITERMQDHSGDKYINVQISEPQKIGTISTEILYRMYIYKAMQIQNIWFQSDFK